jgi:glycosyltransferase involved in cell wall biosynthesis
MHKGNELFLTICTPSYNNAAFLSKLYNSLLAQTCKDFEFILIDDGSTDSTGIVVSELEKQGSLAIRYFWEENSGVHVALNRGLEMARGELFLYLGSDCWLAPDAVEKAKAEWANLSVNDSFGGVVFRKINGATGEPIGETIPGQTLEASHVNAHFRLGLFGDKAEFWRTDLLRMHPYPMIPGEKYFPVGHPYNILSEKYVLRYFDEATYYGQYLPGGLSSNFSARLKKNPRGFLMYYTYLLKFPGLPLRRKAGWLFRIAQCKIAILMAAA